MAKAKTKEPIELRNEPIEIVNREPIITVNDDNAIPVRSTGMQTEYADLIFKPDDNPFGNKSLPESIRYEIEHVTAQTRKDTKEKSLTFCKLDGKEKIYTSADAQGDLNSTDVLPCNARHGKAQLVGDFHTHPATKDTIGITPSEPDLISNLNDSFKHQRALMSCISSPDSMMIHCYYPRNSLIADLFKIKRYNRALFYESQNVADVSPFIRANVGHDFVHAWYDKKTFNKVQKPSSAAVMSDALGQSTRLLRLESIPELQKGSFCDLMQDYNNPSDENLSMECRRRLKTKTILGYRY